ncbi:hypothetical protein N7481_008813 [Penicillium waksmanii]|uniref:uncharacterized protein n=1 Tax=Penicillium waksmanii TaxID=69791 RepID=UPI00254865DD|nr:uncharacterized protein N7481_008813 [Penicillium waksmanii]KAJ5975106.1 hypothetical protein N7481_008813 [Penicillium waksmanii]
MPESRPRKSPARSRKGCPECRERKIKCDETRPECKQCLKSGRACRIIDGLFRAHSLSIPTKTESTSRLKKSPRPTQEDNSSPINATPRAEVNRSTDGPTTPASTYDHASIVSPEKERRLVPIGGLLSQSSPPGTFHAIVDTPPISLLHSPNLPVIASPAVTQNYPTVAGNASEPNPTILGPIIEESHNDRVEVAFFLRQFADLGGQWIDICTGQRSYFSQYIIQLSSQSPLIRYSACAIAAKQLGQMKHSSQATEASRRFSILASSMVQPSIDFEWYGAKYYEKAILLMARQISHGHSIIENHLSPGDIYRSPGSDSNHFDDHETTSSAFRILAACILSSYEELNATMRAWTSHLDGINKLLRPHLDLPISPNNFYRVPQSLRALKASFWYFALNDMLNSLTLRQECRVNVHNVSLWQRMGVPLGDFGELALDLIDESTQEIIFFNTLVYILCEIVDKVKMNNTLWDSVDIDLNKWYNALPPEFLFSITQRSSATTQHSRETPETWFGSDTCAIAMAFYHMARILQLVNEPPKSDPVPSQKPHDLLSIYNALQRGLNYHSTEILSIAGGMTGMTVQKYMLQPLYIAGRCLSLEEERRHVVGLLRHIEASIGLATEYRVRDLADEWGISYHLLSPQADDGNVSVI